MPYRPPTPSVVQGAVEGSEDVAADGGDDVTADGGTAPSGGDD
jgi:hypothetical protein